MQEWTCPVWEQRLMNKTEASEMEGDETEKAGRTQDLQVP